MRLRKASRYGRGPREPPRGMVVSEPVGDGKRVVQDRWALKEHSCRGDGRAPCTCLPSQSQDAAVDTSIEGVHVMQHTRGTTRAKCRTRSRPPIAMQPPPCCHQCSHLSCPRLPSNAVRSCTHPAPSVLACAFTYCACTYREGRRAPRICTCCAILAWVARVNGSTAGLHSAAADVTCQLALLEDT